MNSMELMRKEFDAGDAYAEALRRHNSTPVIDDDYPEVRHEYEGKLHGLIEAMIKNGRFAQGNRYGLKVLF
jgi:hypothetical protein